MNTLFISDIHLEDSEPRATETLLAFLAGPVRSADALYILGDLFEFWIGDDALSVAARQVAKATSELTASGVPCYFMHGNRDFLLGEAYAARAGLRLLPDYRVLDLYGWPTLLLHGDTLCTDDLQYQAFRTQCRDPVWQANVLGLSVEQRLEMARGARDASARHTRAAATGIMDVNEQAVREAFERYGVTRMIHGHTHRPAVHRYRLTDGREAERIVLADWYESGSYLRVSAAGAESVPL
ncbi:MAG: UDP-2,3-diacylglucosamine diphosphatase [Xanthomonadales bacterium]|nr:UDP-2,3-diacylglucosamine diphosphatase [Xanthomonadales bacterium]